MLRHIKSLLKDTTIYAMGNVMGKIVGFILLPFYVEKLTTAEYGVLGTLEAIFQVVVALAGLNLHAAFARWYWDKELQSRQKSTFFTILSAVFLMALLVNIATFPFAAQISSLFFNHPEYSGLIRLMVCAAGLEIICMIPATLCKMQGKPVMYTRSIIIRLLFVLGFTVLFVVFLDRKLEGIYEAQIIGTVIYLLQFIPYMVKNLHFKFEKVILIKMLDYSFPLILSSSFGVMLSIADRLSLNFISGLTSVGIYSLGYKLANTLKMFIVTSVQLALTPFVFRITDRPDAKRIYAKVLTYFTFGLMCFVLGISIFGQEIVKILTARNPDYWGAYTVIPFIAFSIVFGMMKDNTSYGLQIVKKTKIMASIVIIVSVINLGLNMLLIPYLGAIGAASSTLLAQIIYFFTMHHYAQRHYRIPYELTKVFLAIGLGIILCITAMLIHDWGLGLRLFIKTILLVSYPFLLYLFHFFDKAESDAIYGLWKKWKSPNDWKTNIQALINNKP